MTYGLFALGSGAALAWYSSPEEAYEAVRNIVGTEPDAVESLGLIEFEDNGTPGRALEGDELVNAAQSGVAA